MSRFEFKLARLARVRHVQEEQARAKWQSAELEARHAQARVEGLGEQALVALGYLRDLQGQAQLDPGRVLSARRSIELLDSARRSALKNARACRARADVARTPWQNQRAELEGLKRLEDKARARFRLEAEQAEAKESDQLSMERASRKKLDARRHSA